MELAKIISALTEAQIDRLMALMTEHNWNVTEAISNAKDEILSV